MSVQLQLTFFANSGKEVLFSCSAVGQRGKQQECKVTSPVQEVPADARAIFSTSDGLQAQLNGVASGADLQKDKVWGKAGVIGDPLVVQVLFKKQESGLWKLKKVVATCAAAPKTIGAQFTANPRITCDDEDAGEEMLACARYGELEELSEFITSGSVPVDYQNKDYTTALHYACANGEVSCIQFLLQQGAKVLPNSKGNTALHWAIQNSQWEVVKVLAAQARDLDVLAKNAFGKSALTEAMSLDNAEISEVLLGHSSAAELETGKGEVQEEEPEAAEEDEIAKEGAQELLAGEQDVEMKDA